MSGRGADDEGLEPDQIVVEAQEGRRQGGIGIAVLTLAPYFIGTDGPTVSFIGSGKLVVSVCSSNIAIFSAERAGFGRNPAGGGRLRSCFVVAILLRSFSVFGGESASSG